MSKVDQIISQAKDFANSDAGMIAINGIKSMALMAISGVLTAKFFPRKATYGRALGFGIYAVGIQTLFGTIIAAKQEQRIKFSEEFLENSSKEMLEEINRLRGEIARLQEQLFEKNYEFDSGNK